MLRNKLRLYFSISGIIILSCFFIKTFFLPQKIIQTKRIIITYNSSIRKVLVQLQQEQIISYPMLIESFLRVINTLGYRIRLHAGEYIFKGSISPARALYKIIHGETVIRKFTIIAGMTNYQVLAKLNQEAALMPIIDYTPLEGTLLADTYYFTYGMSQKSFLMYVQSISRKRLMQLWYSTKNNPLLHSSFDALILASLVEKESSDVNAMPYIAGVFLNRLRKHMRLQSDVTVIYAITHCTGVLNRPLNKQDFNYVSTYNTYRISRLPLTPISNVSIEALKATLHPIQTDALYFVSNKEHDKHYFAQNFSQHIANIRKIK